MAAPLCSCGIDVATRPHPVPGQPPLCEVCAGCMADLSPSLVAGRRAEQDEKVEKRARDRARTR
jgi:hypothetical protein